MEPGNRGRPYWVIYCAVFIICVVAGSLYQWLYLKAWRLETWMSTLADVFGTSLGAALTLAIFVEGGVAMVLFAPMMIRKYKEQGRQEGLKEGRQEGLAEGRQEGLMEGLMEGRQEGHEEANAAWQAWLQRWREAQTNNQPFDEPPPSQDFPNGQV